MTQTDLYKFLQLREKETFARVEGTEGHWKHHWQQELAAIQRCLWALDGAGK